MNGVKIGERDVYRRRRIGDACYWRQKEEVAIYQTNKKEERKKEKRRRLTSVIGL